MAKKPREPWRRWAMRRVGRHLRWARTGGVRRLIEEDELKPIHRSRIALAKRRWRADHRVDAAMPLFIVGVQRSGTNLVGRLLNEHPEVELYNENRRAAFDRFLLKPDPVVQRLVERSGHQIVAFKPLCDSHRVAHLLDSLDQTGAGKALWVYRSVDDRARSAVAKFGADNLNALGAVARGEGEGLWHGRGLSEANRHYLEGLDFASLSPHSGAALLWYLRNSIYFDHGLDRRDDVLLLSYDDLVSQPAAVWRSVCAFVGLDFRAEVLERQRIREPRRRPPLDLEPSIRARCSELMQRLDTAARGSIGE